MSSLYELLQRLKHDFGISGLDVRGGFPVRLSLNSRHTVYIEPSLSKHQFYLYGSLMELEASDCQNVLEQALIENFGQVEAGEFIYAIDAKSQHLVLLLTLSDFSTTYDVFLDRLKEMGRQMEVWELRLEAGELFGLKATGKQGASVPPGMRI